jgi:hypothetical protein
VALGPIALGPIAWVNGTKFAQTYGFRAQDEMPALSIRIVAGGRRFMRVLNR